MLTVYRALGDHLAPSEAGQDFPPDIVWIDCLRPTREEDSHVERVIGVGLPTREEMEEIEPSSRLSSEDGALYLTAAILCRAESAEPRTSAVTFVLTSRHLATVRYDEPGMMPIAIARLTKPGSGICRPSGALVVLLESAIDRLADVIERTGENIEGLARHVFSIGTERGAAQEVDHTLTLRNIGREGMRLGHIGESLISLSRLLLYLIEKAEQPDFGKDEQVRMKTMLRDVTALADHSRALEDRITFLLDATLGLISIQQNSIIKIFSVLAVIFLPPTLVASAYGMNFQYMPELDWRLGYPFALFLMVASAVITWAVFRWQRWL
jgi:magnesium transporter